MNPPFNLHFTAMPAGPGTTLPVPPSMAFSAPEWGCMRWRIGTGEASATIQMSYVFPPLVDIWVWADAIAHRLLPVALRIDEEGVYTDVHADWFDKGRDLLRLSVRQTDAHGQEYRVRTWQENRSAWLARLGEQLGDHLGDGFDVQAWNNGDAGPVPACHLPWQWPARVAQHTACDWPMAMRRGWFFLTLVYQLDPIVPGQNRRPNDEEHLAKLRFRAMFQRWTALEAAWHTLLDRPFPDTSGLTCSLDRARDLFDEIEFMREGGSVDAGLADASARDNLLRAAVQALETDFHFLYEQVVTALMGQFPLHEGQWLIDEYLRPGRVVQVQNKRWVVDWGELGMSVEGGFRQGYRILWRWPISRPSATTRAPHDLHRRWAAFAASVQTAHLCICPCCGYPHLDEEPEEIMNCPLCGWPLYLLLRRPLPDPEAPISDDSTGDRESWPTLSASRRFFAAHGDAFAPGDTLHTRWLRHPDVADMRRMVAAEFDAWLADPAHDEKPIPDAHWLHLEYTQRSGEIPGTQ